MKFHKDIFKAYDIRGLTPAELNPGVAYAIGRAFADFVPKGDQKETESNVEDILSILHRRPCSADDICLGLSIHKNEAMKYLGKLLDEGAIEGEEKNGVVFYKTTGIGD